MPRGASVGMVIMVLCIGVVASERHAVMTRAGEAVLGLDDVSGWSHPVDFVGGLLRSVLSTTNITVTHRNGRVECLRLTVDDSHVVSPLLGLAAPLASGLGLKFAPPRVEHSCSAPTDAWDESCSFVTSPLARVWVTWSPGCGEGQPVSLERTFAGFAPRHIMLTAVGGSLLFFLAPLLGHNLFAVYASGSLLLFLGSIVFLTWKVASRFASRRVAVASVVASSLGLPVAAGIASVLPGWEVWAEEHQAALGATLIAFFLLSLAATHVFVSRTDVVPLQQVVSTGLRLIGLALVLASHASPTAGWAHASVLVAVAAFQGTGGPAAALAVIEALTPGKRRRPQRPESQERSGRDRITPEEMWEASLKATANEMEKLRERWVAAPRRALPSGRLLTLSRRLSHTTFDKMARLSPDALLAARRLVSRSNTPASDAALTEEQLLERELHRSEARSAGPVKRRRPQLAHAWRSDPQPQRLGSKIPGGWLDEADAAPVDRDLYREFTTVAESEGDDEDAAGSDALSDDELEVDERTEPEPEHEPRRRPQPRFSFGAR